MSLVPTALRMVLDADVDPKSMRSIQVVTSGSAALPVTVQEAFESKYGITVLPSYGAPSSPAGSRAGRSRSTASGPIESAAASVVPNQDGSCASSTPTPAPSCPPTRRGGSRYAVATRDWVRTTDVARIDDDGFLWIDGRSDDAILRGGFKVFPGEIVDVLRARTRPCAMPV